MEENKLAINELIELMYNTGDAELTYSAYQEALKILNAIYAEVENEKE